MNVYQFMSDSPFLTFFIIYVVFGTAFRTWNRLMRHLNIRKHGWPPEHCDADGDFKPEPKASDS